MDVSNSAYTLGEVAAMLRMSRFRIARMFQDGELEGVRVGRRVFFPRESVQALIDSARLPVRDPGLPPYGSR